MIKYILLFALFLPAGCTRHEFPYYYMSFENRLDVEVLEQGKSTVSRIKLHEYMPVQYKVSREAYSLLIDIDRESKHPGSFIRAISPKGAPLKVKAATNGAYSHCGGFDTLLVDIKNDEFLRYEWWGITREECLDKEKISIEKTAKFFVTDEAGKLLGEEELPFKIKKNGVFIEVDAL